MSISDNPNSSKAFAEINTEINDLLGTSGKIVLGVLALFAFWAGFIPMESAVVAPGTVISSGQNKALQHRTGGIVTAIHVYEGQSVKAGAVILELDPAIDQAELTRLRARFAVLSALRRRLEAEKRYTASSPSRRDSANASSIVRPADLPRAEAQIAQEQEREFIKGRHQIAAELDALRQKSEGLKRQREGTLSRLENLKQQIAILEPQHKAAVDLERRGHIAKQQVWDIESKLLDRRAEFTNLSSESKTLVNSIEEAESQYRQTTFKDERATSEKLTDVLGELEQISDQLRAAETALAQTQIRAPVSGTLVRSTAMTVGGVVKSAETVGEIVPEDATLEVEAKVPPKDMAAVHLNQDAKVKISAYSARAFDPLPARVIYVAADSTQDERTDERHFQVRVALTKDALAKSNEHVTVGMTGEVYLQAEPRTFLSYLIRPIRESFARAFGEAS